MSTRGELVGEIFLGAISVAKVYESGIVTTENSEKHEDILRTLMYVMESAPFPFNSGVYALKSMRNILAGKSLYQFEVYVDSTFGIKPDVILP